MRLTPRTILGQLIAGTVVVQVLVFVVFLSFSVRKQFNDTQRRDLDRLRRQTNIIAGLVAEPLTEDDSDLMDHVMHAVPIAASMKGARLTSTDGTMLRNTSNDLPMVLTRQELAMLPDLAMHPRYREFKTAEGDWEGVQPVIADGLVRGILWVTQDQVVAFTTPTRVLDSLLLYAPFALVGNLLLVWALSGSLARPLRRLRRASQQVQLDPNDLSAFPLPAAENNEAGELTASVNAMVNEIAAQRRGTQDTLNLLDSMLTGAPIGFGFYDREFRYVRVNDHLAKMHRVSSADHIGRRLRDILPATASAVAGEVEGFIQRVFETQKPLTADEIRADLSGSGTSTFQASYFPVFAGGEVRWVGVIATDITERRLADEAVRRSEKLAAAGRLAASIANDISNPLEGVANLLYLLRENGSLDAEAREYVSMAQSGIARVGEITEQALNLYRTSKSASELDITDVLRDVLSLYAARLQTSKIEVQSRTPKGALLFGYPGELRQLFANLISQMIEAAPQGGNMQLKVQNGRRADLPGIFVTVACANAGMPDAARWRVYETAAAARETGGDDLAVWANDEIVMKHGASVKVRTRKPRFRGDGSSSVVRIFFPVRGVPRLPFIVHSAAPVLAGRGV